MERQDLDKLKDNVSCALVLEQAGYAIDTRESTRRAIKYRRGAEIVIVIHEGRGWFDPLSDAKGDVFNLIQRVDEIAFGQALERIATLVGHAAIAPAWKRPPHFPKPLVSISTRWKARTRPSSGSPTWRYLSEVRLLPEFILQVAIRQDVVREGPHGSLWAGHVDHDGTITGWEERGSDWRGFSSGGAKILFRFGDPDATRLCVTEAAIDAMSLAAIEGLREGTLYLSTGGGWSPKTDLALRKLVARNDALLIAATDANPQGEAYAERLRELAEEVGCSWLRFRPPAGDWNDALKIGNRESRKR